MVKKTPNIKDGSNGAGEGKADSSAVETRSEGAVERLLAFLDDDEDDNTCSTPEASRDELSRDAAIPQKFSERLKQTVIEAYRRAQSEAEKDETWWPREITPECDVNWPVELADVRRVLAVPALGSPQPSRLDLQVLPEADRLGMAGTLINMMGAHERLVVRSFNAISSYTALSQQPTDIGRNERADCVLHWGGGVAGERLIVSAQLLRGFNGEPLGEKRIYDESLTNVYKLSGQISQQIAKDLNLKLPDDVMERRKHRYTKDPVAVRSYNLGRFYWNKFTEPDLVTAIGEFENCIERDPGFAEAFAGIADCYTWMGILNMRSPQATFELAREKARQALSRDDGIAEAHTSLAFTEMYFDWNWEGAEERFLHAISLNPNYETAYQGYAQLMMALMRFDEALAAIEQALLIHPKSFIINVAKGIILYEAGRFDECIKQFKENIELNPRFDASYYGHALALEQKGLLKLAEKESRRAIVRSKRNPIKLTARAHIHALLKETRQARTVLDELDSLRSTHQYVSPFHMALIYAGLGETDQAFDFLEQAYRDKDQWVTLLRSEPRLKELRGDPRFRSLVRRLNWPTN
jgi:tetratricopeptide (TPR) repeat protein